MSSFKRRAAPSTSQSPPGTKPLPFSSNVHVTSTGIPSLDDVLGGGLQLGTDLLILNPDPHSSHANLIQKYIISQGIAAGHHVHVFGHGLREFVDSCMWIPGVSEKPPVGADDEELADDKVKIAWRYERMEKFKTTVASSSSQDDYCSAFDLSCRIPASIIESSLAQQRITLRELSNLASPYEDVISTIGEVLSKTFDSPSSGSTVVRVVLPSFSDPMWGDASQEEILAFLLRLRSLLRRYPSACCALSLPSHISSDASFGSGWVDKLGWLSDACISLDSASADPSNAAMLPSHHGLLRIISLPRVQTLVPASDRSSTLRGIASSSASASSSGVGENNLAFKCTRKRLVFETFHLDVEGGVGERRTTPAANSVLSDDSHGPLKPKTGLGPDHDHERSTAGAAMITVELAEEGALSTRNVRGEDSQTKVDDQAVKPRTKVKRKVGFQMDKPDVYDF